MKIPRLDLPCFKCPIWMCSVNIVSRPIQFYEPLYHQRSCMPAHILGVCDLKEGANTVILPVGAGGPLCRKIILRGPHIKIIYTLVSKRGYSDFYFGRGKGFIWNIVLFFIKWNSDFKQTVGEHLVRTSPLW